MRKKTKRKRESIMMKFDGKKIELQRWNILPKCTIALSADLFDELKRGDRDD